MRKTTKKAQSISMNTIVIAAIALLVLIVLAAIFTGRTKIFGSEIKKCENLGGDCVGRRVCAANEKEITGAFCPQSAPKCCLVLYEDNNN